MGQTLLTSPGTRGSFRSGAWPISSAIWPNGCGKTTLLKLLPGQFAPRAGSVTTGTTLQVVYLDQLRDRIDPGKTMAVNVAGVSQSVHFQGCDCNLRSCPADFLFRAGAIHLVNRPENSGGRHRYHVPEKRPAGAGRCAVRKDSRRRSFGTGITRQRERDPGPPVWPRKALRRRVRPPGRRCRRRTPSPRRRRPKW